MPNEINYYAVVGPGRSISDPSGLARRTLHAEGRLDESLTPGSHLGYEAPRSINGSGAKNFGPDLVEIGAQEAEALIERFREKWA